MMKLVLFTGMRRGEIFRLQWGDIDLQRGFIDIRNPKGGKSVKIPLNAGAKEILESVPSSSNSPYVFQEPTAVKRP